MIADVYIHILMKNQDAKQLTNNVNSKYKKEEIGQNRQSSHPRAKQDLMNIQPDFKLILALKIIQSYSSAVTATPIRFWQGKGPKLFFFFFSVIVVEHVLCPIPAWRASRQG